MTVRRGNEYRQHQSYIAINLRDLLDNAQGVPAEQVMLRAADLLGKSVGLYKDVQVQQEPQKSAAELEAELVEMLASLTDKPEDAMHSER